MGGPVKPNFAFPTMVDFDLDDWTAAVFGGQVHVVRRLTSSGAFEHAVVSPDRHRHAGGNVQAQASKLASGLVLAPYGDSLVLMALDANAGSNVVYSVYDGTSWSGWATLVSIGKSGSWLGGFTPETGASRPSCGRRRRGRATPSRGRCCRRPSRLAMATQALLAEQCLIFGEQLVGVLHDPALPTSQRSAGASSSRQGEKA